MPQNNASYKVVSTESALQTPNGNYEDLLQIEFRTQWQGMDFFFNYYYQKGKGFIGATNGEGMLVAFELIDYPYMPAMAAKTKTCASLDNIELAVYCTMEDIYTDIGEMLDKKGIAGAPGESINLLLHINTKGAIEAIYDLGPGQNNSEAKEAVKRMLEKYEKLEPAYREGGEKIDYFYMFQMFVD